MTETELLVVGGGPAGYTAAVRAAEAGLDVTLVERDGVGGTCLNRGCIPSKALIHAASVADSGRTSERIGVDIDVRVDFERVRRWTERTVQRLAAAVEERCVAAGVSLVAGEASFAGPATARIDAKDGELREIRFERAIVATGSRSAPCLGFDYGDEPVLDAAALLERGSLPERLAVVGAGYVGTELALALAKLGTAVTVIEFEESLLPTYPADLVRPVERTAADLGVERRFGRRATRWSEAERGVRVRTESADGTGSDGSVAADAVLVAAGREPVTDALDLDAAGVETDSRGFVRTDGLRTTQDRILAAGDVRGDPMLAHAGRAEGRLVADLVTGVAERASLAAVPETVFTDPEIARVGRSEAAAADAGYDPAVGECRFRGNGRALTRNDASGFVRVVADGDSGRVLGGELVGPEASELVAELALAVESDLTLAALAETVHAHPTLAEATMAAAEDAFDGTNPRGGESR